MFSLVDRKQQQLKDIGLKLFTCYLCGTTYSDLGFDAAAPIPCLSQSLLAASSGPLCAQPCQRPSHVLFVVLDSVTSLRQCGTVVQKHSGQVTSSSRFTLDRKERLPPLASGDAWHGSEELN